MMSRVISTVLFDLNETLIYQVRTDRSHMAITYAALAQYNWDITLEAFETAWTNVHARNKQKFQEGSEMLRIGNLDAAAQNLRENLYRENIFDMMKELKIYVPNRVIEKVTRAFQDSWIGGLRIPSQNLSTLQKLISAGYQLGLLTNFQQPDIIPDILHSFGLEHLFKTTVISGSVGWRKPFPEIFNCALQALNMNNTPEQAVYVGDNPEEDVEGARRVGLHPILIDPKRRYVDLYGDTLSIQSITELPEALIKINSVT